MVRLPVTGTAQPPHPLRSLDDIKRFTATDLLHFHMCRQSGVFIVVTAFHGTFCITFDTGVQLYGVDLCNEAVARGFNGANSFFKLTINGRSEIHGKLDRVLCMIKKHGNPYAIVIKFDDGHTVKHLTKILLVAKMLDSEVQELLLTTELEYWPSVTDFDYELYKNIKMDVSLLTMLVAQMLNLFQVNISIEHVGRLIDIPRRGVNNGDIRILSLLDPSDLGGVEFVIQDQLVGKNMGYTNVDGTFLMETVRDDRSHLVIVSSQQEIPSEMRSSTIVTAYRAQLLRISITGAVRVHGGSAPSTSNGTQQTIKLERC